MLGKARHQEDPLKVLEMARACQDEMQDRVIYLLDSVELMKAWLIAGEAQAVMGRPDRVFQTMMTLRESAYFDELGPAESLDYRYLLGFGALGVGKVELAMRAVEWFLIHAEDDPRRGQAYVLLSEAYLAQDRFLEARAASVEARKRFLMRMPPHWRERALKAWARTALALGEKEEAFLELEQIALRGDELELTLFLVDELLVVESHVHQLARHVVLEYRQRDRIRNFSHKPLHDRVPAVQPDAPASVSLAARRGRPPSPPTRKVGRSALL